MPYEPSDTIGALTDAQLATFLAEPWNGRIATITPEGWPYVAAVWYEFERDRHAFLVVGRERAQWIAHIRVNPRVAFHVADDLHAQHTDPRLSRRYLGSDGPRYAEHTIQRPRVLVRLEPVRWTTWTGREWHPRYR